MEPRYNRIKLETDFYWQYFEHAHLNVDRDGRWLTDMTNSTFDDNWLRYINAKNVGIGSADFESSDQVLHPVIYNARQEFFEDTLGWGDSEHPLHETYAKFRERYPDLEAPATIIMILRRLDDHGVDIISKIAETPKFLTIGKVFDSSEPEDVSERTEQINHAVDRILAQPIRVKQAPQRKTAVGAKAVNGKSVLMPSESLIAERAPHLLEVGFTQDTIDNNTWALIRHSSADIDKFLKLFANYGVDGIKMMSGHLQGLEKVETAEQRLAAMQAMGLHVPSVLEGYGDALCIKSEMISEKIPVIGKFLDAVKSDVPVASAISERPKMLARSATKFLAVAGVLEGSTDTSGMHIRYVEPFARNSLDLTFAAMVRRKQDGEMVHASDLDKTARIITADHRRDFNLDAMRDVYIRSLLTTQAIKSYLVAAPLTEKEQANYPELADLAG